MILRDATIQYSGNDPDKLSRGSHVRICVSCDGCGRVKWCNYQAYRDLCKSCSRKGKNSSLYKNKIIKVCQICGEKFEVHLSQQNQKCCSNKCRGKRQSINQIGENNPNYNNHILAGRKQKIEDIKKRSQALLGRKVSVNTKKKISDSLMGRFGGNKNPMYGVHLYGELNPNWKGGNRIVNRDHVLPINQCLHINKRFKGSHGHHISSDVVIFIPKELHYHISHNLKSGKGMNEMNMLSLQYLRG